MNRILVFGLVFIVLAFMSGCAEEQIEATTSFKIKFGTECGWCAGQEYITITESEVEYLRNIPCGEEKGIRNKNRDLLSEEWESIINSFDYDLFQVLDYNQCNVCADGCDEIIEIEKNNSSHQLRYSFSDEVEGMEILRQKLTELMEEMRLAD